MRGNHLPRSRLSCSCCVPPATATALILPPPSLEPESPAERTARHLRMCRRLAEIGMVLAEATAQETLDAAPTEPAPPNAEPHPTHHPAIRFARLAASVRQAIALERRIVAAQAEAAYPNRHRREALRPALHHAANQHPNPPALKRAIDTALDDALSNPNSPDSLWDLHTNLCETFGLILDYTTWPASELLACRDEERPEALPLDPAKDKSLEPFTKGRLEGANWFFAQQRAGPL